MSDRERIGLAWHRDVWGGLYIDHAEPRTAISYQLLNEVREGMRTIGSDFEASVEGDVLRIRGVNRTVIYRLGEEIPTGGACWGEWPD